MSNLQVMKPNTSCKYIALAIRLFDWATDNDYLPKKITNNFSTGKDKKAKRLAFSSKDLDKLFSSHKTQQF